MIKYVQYFVEIIPFHIFILLTRYLPFDIRVKIGGYWFGFLITNSRKLRNRILSNLKLVEDTFSVKDKDRFVKSVGNSVGRVVAELIFNEDFMISKSKIKFEGSVPRALVTSKRNKRPIILVSGHFGQWEAIRILLKNKGFEVGAIYRKIKNPFFESIYMNSIRLGGTPMFPAGFSGTKQMIKYLRNGGILALLLDQAVSDGDDFTFFGLKAKTSVAIAELANKYNADIIPCYGIRGSDGITIHVVFEESLDSKDPIQITQSLNDSLETRVRANPTQWHWIHNRWKA